MRPFLLSLALMLAAASATATPAPAPLDPSSGDVPTIRLGEAPPPPAAVDPTKIRAVERFLAARQEASTARVKGRAPRLGMPAPKGAKNEDLFGAPGDRIAAFDFQDASIEPTGPGRFRVTVYVLFSDDAGQIVESRDEILTFAGSGGLWSCVSIRTAAGMAWDSGAVRDIAASLGVTDALEKARAHLRDWSSARRSALGYSVADIVKEADGTVRVPCLRFKAEPGRRGFVVDDRPVVLSRSQGGVLIESN